MGITSAVPKQSITHILVGTRTAVPANSSVSFFLDIFSPNIQIGLFWQTSGGDSRVGIREYVGGTTTHPYTLSADEKIIYDGPSQRLIEPYSPQSKRIRVTVYNDSASSRDIQHLHVYDFPGTPSKLLLTDGENNFPLKGNQYGQQVQILGPDGNPIGTDNAFPVRFEGEAVVNTRRSGSVSYYRYNAQLAGGGSVYSMFNTGDSMKLLSFEMGISNESDIAVETGPRNAAGTTQDLKIHRVGAASQFDFPVTIKSVRENESSIFRIKWDEPGAYKMDLAQPIPMPNGGRLQLRNNNDSALWIQAYALVEMLY